jgi:hypothetical protein
MVQQVFRPKLLIFAASRLLAQAPVAYPRDLERALPSRHRQGVGAFSGSGQAGQGYSAAPLRPIYTFGGVHANFTS